MTFTTVWLWTLLRSLVLMGLALPWCGWLVRWIRTSPAQSRGWQLGLLVLPVVFPLLLTGYAYSQMTRLLITGWWTREVWFDLLLLLRVIPIGTLLWYFSPPSPLSREAWYARVLAIRPGEPLWQRYGIFTWYWLQGPARAGLFAASGLFLVLFSEFELASLLATTSWTVWLFDAQAGGLSLSESLKCCVGPACCTWVACGALPWTFAAHPSQSATQSANEKPVSLTVNLACWIYLTFAWGFMVLYPCVLIGRETFSGLIALLANSVQARGLAQGILVAAGNALIAGVSVDMLAHLLVQRGGRSPWIRATILASGICLCGSLVITLSLVALFQQAWLNPFYDSTLPVLLGLVLWLLPRAIMLQAMLQAIRSPISEHSARLLLAGSNAEQARGARDILWNLHGRNVMLVRLLLCHWAYWETTLPHILNPAGLVTAPDRLYIDMHFGRNAVLTAKAGLTLVVPLLLVTVSWPWLKRSAG